MRIFYLSLTFVVFQIYATGQTGYTAKLPELLPPSPDAAAFIKAGIGNVNKSTGAVLANIPLYELRTKYLSMPVTLNYQSQGTKVDEIPSRVGLGWSLNAGGVITRTVRGAPDEVGIQLSEPADLHGWTQSLFNYFDYASKAEPVREWDTEKDEFSFSVNGYSGKFWLDANDEGVIQSHSNVKIKAYRTYQDFTGFIITTPDGVKYSFGYNGSAERTISHNLWAYSHSATFTKTSFFLNKIEHVTGEQIELTYGTVNILTHPGITHTVVKLREAGAEVCGGYGCPPANTIIENSIKNTRIEYESKFLQTIVCSNGLQASFTYENVPDQSWDKRIASIEFKYSLNRLKLYYLRYLDPPGQNGAGQTPAGGSQINGRFFLSELALSEADENGTEPVVVERKHIFEYEDVNGLPPRLSFAQDHFGFANAYTFNFTFIPPQPGLSNTTAQANRDYSPEIAKKGVLKKITFPTGGTEEIFVEANTIPGVEKVNTMTSTSLNGEGIGLEGGNDINYYYGNTINILRDQAATLSASSFQSPAYSGTYTPTSYDDIVIAKIKDVGTGVYIYTAIQYAYSSASYTVNLLGGHSYQLELQIKRGPQSAGSASLNYDYSASDTYINVNKVTGGVRVSNIRLYDPVTRGTINKYYKYTALSDLSKSTGSAAPTTSYKHMLRDSKVPPAGETCWDGGEYVDCWGPCNTVCRYDLYTSNSVFPLYSYNGSHIYYSSVIESESKDFSTGGIEYTFFTGGEARTDIFIRGEPVPGIPNKNHSTHEGLLQKQRVFNKDLFVVQEDLYEYESDSSYRKEATSVHVKRHYKMREPAFNPDGTVTHFTYFEPFDVVKYSYVSIWHRLKSVVKIHHDPVSGTMINTVSYNYGNSVNTAPRKVTSTNSKGVVTAGDIVERLTYYPTDFSQTVPVLNTLKLQNNIELPVEEVTTINGIETQRKKILFRDWFGDGKVIAPEFIQLQETPAAPLATKIIFSGYDNKGNTTEVAKAAGLKISYLYDYQGTLPVAEIKNAAVSSVAYSSFEAEGAGGWTITGTIDLSTGFTGTKCLDGTATKTVATAGVYIITLWTSGSALVNNLQGTLMSTKRGWSLWKWELTNPTTIEVSGNNLDDLRLYPRMGEMITYTHIPYMGIQSVSDINSIPTYYEYDPSGRLKLIRDADENIVKLFKYVYQEGMPACINTTASWMPTGNFRCVKTSNNNNTGEQQKEERDMNHCSSTFYEYRWVSNGVSSNCPVVPNCSSENQRVVRKLNPATGQMEDMCEIGQKIVLDAYANNGGWTCTYYYTWSDGFQSQTYSVFSTESCFPIE